MDLLTFVSTMTTALAWPCVAGAIAVAYRREIRALVAGMKKLKLGPVEAEMFEQQAREVRDLALSSAVADKTTADHEGHPRELDDQLLNLLTRSPRDAILAAWDMMQDAVRSLGERHGIDPGALLVTILLELRHKQVISANQYQLLRKVYDLGAQAATTSVLYGPEGALNYVVAVSHALQRVGGSDKPGRSWQLRKKPIGTKLPEYR
jgi:hypothetical protein